MPTLAGRLAKPDIRDWITIISAVVCAFFGTTGRSEFQGFFGPDKLMISRRAVSVGEIL